MTNLLQDILEDFAGCAGRDVARVERRGYSVHRAIEVQRRYRGAECPWAKLTQAQVLEIRCSTERPYVLAARYGVSSRTIRNARTGVTYGAA